ncbi:hypothetical protein BH10BAC2_BH10BAC2_16360 [soil metagenome]
MDFRGLEQLENKPLITIGMSSYNYARYIKAALDSLLTQTYTNIELIIIDDYSKDNSVEIIENWISENDIQCTFVRHNENIGITKTSNEFVKLAKGKYLTLAASDDIMLPERIEKQVDILEEAGEEYGMCYALPEYMNEDGKILNYEWKKSISEFYEGDVLEDYVHRRFWFITPTSLIRTAAYAKTGLYDERILIEDYNFFLRLVACYKVKYCSYPCIIYRVKTNGTQIFKEWEKNNYERYFYERILSNLQGLEFIKQKDLRSEIKRKITQYLKCLAIYNSPSFFKALWFLLGKGYFSIPPKLVLIKLAKSTGLLPKVEINLSGRDNEEILIR